MSGLILIRGSRLFQNLCVLFNWGIEAYRREEPISILVAKFKDIISIKKIFAATWCKQWHSCCHVIRWDPASNSTPGNNCFASQRNGTTNCPRVLYRILINKTFQISTKTLNRKSFKPRNFNCIRISLSLFQHCYHINLITQTIHH